MLRPNTAYRSAPQSRFAIEPIREQPNNQFWFNHLIGVVLPDTLHTPPTLKKLFVEDCEYYKVTRLSASQFIEWDFKENFLKNGTLSALSIDGRIDCDDCMCVTPRGLLILSLTKFTYEGLGIPGTPSKFYSNAHKYVVKINLLDECLKPTKKGYNRIKQRLRDALAPFTVLVRWEPHNPLTCPSSVAAYFSSLRHNVQLCLPETLERLLFSVTVPPVDFAAMDTEDAYAFIEWLGHAYLQCTPPTDDRQLLTTYHVPGPHEVIGQVKVAQFRGFFTTKTVAAVLEIVKEHVTPQRKWGAIYVQGFSDAPVSAGTLEHHYHTNGDYAYTYLVNPNNCVLTCKQVPSYKKHK